MLQHLVVSFWVVFSGSTNPQQVKIYSNFLNFTVFGRFVGISNFVISCDSVLTVISVTVIISPGDSVCLYECHHSKMWSWR